MSTQAGLVGLPNVGKSTLFNALTKSGVPAENYPFCTIDPHVAITFVPDPRLDKLATVYGSAKKIPATVTFVDIAGLVKGAASGEGLGNQFLSHIREVDLILHVVRCFEDSSILHSSPTIDPLEDHAIIMAELALRDIDSIEKRLEKLPRLIKVTHEPKEIKELTEEQDLLVKLRAQLDKGAFEAVRPLYIAAEVKTIPLLTAKRFIIIANITEVEIENDGYKNNPHYQKLVAYFGANSVVPVCAKAEYELSRLSEEEAQEMMGILGLKESALDAIIRKTYENLGLITFFTCGPKEAHAWPITKGTTVRAAAGEIHSDLERGFICADVFNCADLFMHGSEAKLRDVGKIRREGQDYLVTDGDLLNIKFNV